MVELRTVNAAVVGSSPTLGAISFCLIFRGFLQAKGAKKADLPEELPEDLGRI